MFLIKRKSVYYIRYFDEIENRQRQFSTGCKSKQDALRFLTNFKYELKNKEKLQFITLENFKTEYLNHIERNYSKKYYSIVNYTFINLIKHTGNIPLIKLNQSILEKYLFSVFDKAKYNASLYYRNLRASLNFAIEKNYLEINPLEKFKLPNIPEKANLYIDEIEFNLILDKTENNVLKKLFLFAYNTGMRLSEIANLKWSSISFNDGLISVVSDASFTTKNKKTRTIPFNNILSEILRDRLPKVIDISKEIYVFNIKGKMINPDYISKSFKKAVKEAKLNNDYHFHLLRASFISNLAKRNVPLIAIQKLVGHANIRITEKHYLTVQNELLTQAMQALDNKVMSKVNY